MTTIVTAAEADASMADYTALCAAHIRMRNAAPAMLAAMRLVERAYLARDLSSGPAALLAAYEAARAAIAQAEGRT